LSVSESSQGQRSKRNNAKWHKAGDNKAKWKVFSAEAVTF